MDIEPAEKKRLLTSDKINEHKHGGAKGSRQTIKGLPRILWQVLHLDTDSGGDAAIILARSDNNTDEATGCVIDGGHGKTGMRLIEYTKNLPQKGKEITHCIVSHFDTDHWSGVAKWLDHMKSQEIKPKIVTPVKPEEMKMVYQPTQPGEDYTGQYRFSLRHRDLPYYDLKDKKIDIGILDFTLVKGSQDATIESICKNEQSLRWHIRCKLGQGVDYYTGGDGEFALPVNTTIVKLDHHGGCTNGSNSNLTNLDRCLLFIISGPGKVHDHPAPSVVKDIQAHQTRPKYMEGLLPERAYKAKAKAETVATRIHFHGLEDIMTTGETPNKYGDLLVSVYEDGGIKATLADGTERWITNMDGKPTDKYPKGWLEALVTGIGGVRPNGEAVPIRTARGESSAKKIEYVEVLCGRCNRVPIQVKKNTAEKYQQWCPKCEEEALNKKVSEKNKKKRSRDSNDTHNQEDETAPKKAKFEAQDHS
jgi:beta-lactamase superfamily II metal-dependent hydrolase